MTAGAQPSGPLLVFVPALFVLLWSTGFIGAKLGLPYAEPLTFLLIRFACVIGLLGLLAIGLRRPWPRSAQQYGHLAVAGSLLHGGYLSGVFSAINNGMGAGVVALIVGVQPLLTAFLGGWMLAERLNLRQWVGFVLGFGGVVLVVWDKLGVGGVTLASLLLSAMALLSMTAGTLYQKRYCGAMDLWSGSVVQFAAAALVLLPFALAIETMQVSWTGRFVFALSWLILVLSIGAISLLHILIKRGAATRVSALFYLTPPTTAVLAYLVFDERLTPTALAGMALAALGVWLALRR
jgi:drug/metabolite transporter (DMT)-like permease